MAKKNVTGIKIKKARFDASMTLDQCAAKCNLLGWDITLHGLAKIESNTRRVNDIELFILAEVLKVEINYFYPKTKREVFKAAEGIMRKR